MPSHEPHAFDKARQQAFEAEMLPYMRALYGFALRLCGNREDAADLVQETYLKAYRFFDRYETGTNAKAWLFRILKNSFINRYRRRVREPDRVDLEEIQEYYYSLRDETLSESTDLAELLDRQLLDDEVTAALQSLPVDFRTVVILCDLEGFTYEEIADLLEIPIGTVRSRLHRGRKLLRLRLLEYARQRGYKVDEHDAER
ncbi:MAG: sigma-70 family RNA polymerase sigma factor [Bacteroidota bacterium]|nr:sigma-70 family RNA polymerase sigma factor [Rhodothermia bacterium]MDW8285376.1 sigma-70 family RNA polymerase sigma factor [Bacteroidota bacterium]